MSRRVNGLAGGRTYLDRMDAGLAGLVDVERRTHASGGSRASEVPLAGDARHLGLERACFESRRSISQVDTPLSVPILSFQERSRPSLRRVVTAPARRHSPVHDHDWAPER